MVDMLRSTIRLMRPHQWLKNVFVLAGLAFGERLGNDGVMVHVLAIDGWTQAVLRSVAAAAVFAVVSSAIYVFNDLQDAAVDALHPVKRSRPIASGAVSKGLAVVLGVILLSSGIVWANVLSPRLMYVMATYTVINVLYTIWWKNAVILDILSVASGFVLRVIAGVVVVGAVIGPWIVTCTLFLALLISLGKRRSEITLLGDEAGKHRKILKEYPMPFLDVLLICTSAMTVITYALFAVESDRSAMLVLTIPMVLYGVFRYMYLIYVRGTTLPPESLVVHDSPLLFTGILWVTVTAALMSMT
jgi:4-hydroxybenzoate polyprenyltransferase